MKLTIACVFAPEGLEAFTMSPPRAPVDVMILPELFDGGYKRLAAGGTSTDAMMSRFADISAAHNLHLIAGTLALPDSNGQTGNICPVFSYGKEAGRFPKLHLFRPLGDDKYFAPGEPVPTLNLPCRNGPLRCGVIVCYDLRFPEAVRPWFKTGLDLLAVPARWPRVRDDIWQSLLRARAIENQCFVVGVDARDDEGGGSYAFGPSGDELFSLGPDPAPDEPPWHTFTIETEDIARAKSRLDTHADARFL